MFGKYRVYENGDIVSTYFKNPRRLSPSVNMGYLRVSLQIEGTSKYKNFTIHRLVAVAFLGDMSADGLIVLHNDGNKLNNHVSNLRWGSHKDNSNDARIHGKVINGSNQHLSKLKESDIQQIFNMNLEMSSIKIAAIYGVSDVCIRNILHRKTWKHIKSEGNPILHNRGKFHHRSFLTDESIDKIKFLSSKISVRAISKMLGISRTAINRAISL